MTVTLTDGDGDQVATTATDISTHISFFDDGPTAPTVTVSAATVGGDETPGVQHAARIDGPVGLDTGHVQRHGGHVDCQHLLDGRHRAAIRTFARCAALAAIGYAASELSSGTLGALFAAGGRQLWGGWSGHDELALSLCTRLRPPALTLTDGTAITLSLDGAGRVIGTVAGRRANSAERQDGVCDRDRSDDG